MGFGLFALLLVLQLHLSITFSSSYGIPMNSPFPFATARPHTSQPPSSHSGALYPYIPYTYAYGDLHEWSSDELGVNGAQGVHLSLEMNPKQTQI